MARVEAFRLYDAIRDARLGRCESHVTSMSYRGAIYPHEFGLSTVPAASVVTIKPRVWFTYNYEHDLAREKAANRGMDKSNESIEAQPVGPRRLGTYHSKALVFW